MPYSWDFDREPRRPLTKAERRAIDKIFNEILEIIARRSQSDDLE